MSAPIDLLWTGGWDSTYRLLHATLVQGLHVQPHYVIDLRRPGALAELKAMETIRRAVQAKNSDARRRIKPTATVVREEIPQSDAVASRFQALRKQQWVGDQYEWLTRYALWRGLTKLELAIHKDDRAHDLVANFTVYDDSGVFVVTDSADEHMRAIFGKFAFPILHTSKVDMAETASRLGFLDIMNHTWFCHYPDARNQPCGLCNPCVSTMLEGMAQRIPAKNRFKSQLRYLLGIKRASRYGPSDPRELARPRSQ